MVDGVRSRGQKLTREVIDAITRGNARATRMIEGLVSDVGEVLPDSVDAAQAVADAAQATADTAQSAADSAQTTADGAQAAAGNAQSDATDALTQLSTFSAIPLLVLTASGALSDERVLTQGDGIKLTDAGPGLALTVAIDANVSLKDSLGNVVVQIGDNGAASKLGFFGVAPILRPTTALAPGAFVANAGTAVNDASTFEGYTLAQIAKALKDIGLLT